MRVCHIGDESTTVRAGGLGRYVSELAMAQRACGSDVSVHVVGDAEASERSVIPPARSPLRRIMAHRRALADDPPDVVDVHFALYGSLVPRSLPLVAHFHGPWWAEAAAQGDRRGASLRRAVEGRLLRRAARVVVLSHYTAGMAVTDHRVDPGRIAVIPPGVDLHRFQPGDRAAARARLGLPDDARVALAVRRLVRRTGVDLLLEAWRRDPGPGGALLLLAGTGPEGERLRADAAGMDSVRFLGRVDDDTLPDLYRAADVSVVPSRSLEGFGLVVLESMACGTPVVATAVGGLPEVLADRPGCLVVEPRPEALADGLARALAASPDPIAVRRSAETNDWRTVAEAHHVLYREIGADR